jgi:hypothetical protein
MLNGCSLSVLIIAGLSSLGMVGLQVYTIAIDYPLNIFTDSSVQYNWSGILSCIELGTAIGVLMLSSVTAIPYLEVLNIKNRGPLKFATIYYAVFSLTSIVIAMYRVSETGTFLDIGVCSRTEGDLVCPTVLYRTEMDISNTSDCKFNNFADSPSVWNTNAVPRIDWSDKDMYDKSSQGLLFTAFKAARGEVTISEDEMTLYHDCWYWGCDSVCNDRYTINRALAFASCVASVMYLALATLSGVQSGFDSDYKEVPTDPVDIPMESIPTVDGIKLDELLIEIPMTPEPDEEDIEEGDQADKSGAASGDGSPEKEWNFRLRM